MSLLILFQNIRGTLTRRVLGLHFTTGVNEMIPLAGYNNTLHFTTASNDFTVD
jgi:hypothetical protein